eukprot:CAMPEP_0196806760 /NCGR_PEP_ID=MMETSP1362-20130617/6674_1 /TAXON_ID=163516 /ORGANISM="Leptocylindrus danicus, Strain CCMP1856" /LENGTH=915 /DNA_ID=CAMNT_0042180381 /DNA_START=5 /DNA_END=2752 /DNA_ORIENTATION=+
MTSDHGEKRPPTYLERWAHGVHRMNAYIGGTLQYVVRLVIKFPVITIIASIIYCFGLLGIGMSSGFELLSDADLLWTPQDSYPVINDKWIKDESGFTPTPRYFNLIVHKDGDNTLSVEGTQAMFEAMKCVRDTPGYATACEASTVGYCDIVAPSRFFDNDQAVFEAQVGTDETLNVQALSSGVYSDGVRAQRNVIFGNADPITADPTQGEVLTSTLANIIVFSLPTEDEYEDIMDFENDALDNCLDMRDDWADGGFSGFRLEVNAETSSPNENARGAQQDLPLVGAAFIVMGAYCAVVLGKCHPVKSQALLGFGAVVGILMSTSAGYGLALIIGQPFTNLALILPFILVGVGLDDAFILTGEFALTNPEDSLNDRLLNMILKGGAAISITTLTNIIAFALGSSSNIPAASWFCVYAAFSIMFDFIVQITYFVALIMFDQKRISANKYDCAVCVTRKGEDPVVPEAETNGGEEEKEKEPDGLSKMLGSYMDILLNPKVKVLVLLTFLGMFILGIVGMTYLEEDFDPVSLLPPDSYVVDFVDASDTYNSNNDGIAVGIYFRELDPSLQTNQDAMNKMVQDIVALDQVDAEPVFYWLRDMKAWLAGDNVSDEIKNSSFNDQVTAFLAIPANNLAYGQDIVRNDNGDVTASRTFVFFNGIGVDSQKGVEALFDQRDVTKDQPLNDGREVNGDWVLFTYAGNYYLWEFFSVIRLNLAQTVVLGFGAVALVALISLPDPRMAIIVVLTVFIVDVELLGMIPAAGLAIDPLTFLALTMAIGLVVDYCVHIVHAYLEGEGHTRDEQIKTVMTEIGASILTGAFSTLLGVLLLAFSSSKTFQTFFVMFLGIILLGAGHGFIFIPVVLSLVGPVNEPGSHAAHGEGGNHDDLKLKEEEEEGGYEFEGTRKIETNETPPEVEVKAE